SLCRKGFSQFSVHAAARLFTLRPPASGHACRIPKQPAPACEAAASRSEGTLWGVQNATVGFGENPPDCGEDSVASLWLHYGGRSRAAIQAS
ncbi:hypothetical protein ABTA54_19495, partial [Acinetobacter baumannii]